MSRLVVALVLVGCNAQPLASPRVDAGVLEGDVQSASGEASTALPDASLVPADAPAPVMEPDAAPASPDLAPPDLAPLPDLPVPVDLPPDLPADLSPPGRCPMGVASTWAACSVKVGEKDFFRRRDGNQCGLCTFTPDHLSDRMLVSQCMMGEQDYPLYCASSCEECCHTERRAPCEVATDCCQPLHCIASTCQLPP